MPSAMDNEQDNGQVDIQDITSLVAQEVTQEAPSTESESTLSATAPPHAGQDLVSTSMHCNAFNRILPLTIYQGMLAMVTSTNPTPRHPIWSLDLYPSVTVI